jgi:hypothetical protein
MPWSEVAPALLDVPPGILCTCRYPGHPRGCPNYGKRATCPPQAKRFTAEYLATREWVVIWNAFPFGEHVERMRIAHPGWTERQLANCLYWQGTARNQLAQEIVRWQRDGAILCPVIERVPEAHGIDVTQTMERVGIFLEWPPRTVAYQVALAAVNPTVAIVTIEDQE